MIEDQRRAESASRRRVLVLIAGALLVGLGGIAGHVFRGRRRPAEWREVARRMRLDELDVEALGRAYLADHPAEASAAFLSAELPPADRDELIEHARQADFATGRIVRVDRWLLSRTEARVAALIVAQGSR